MQHGVHGIKFEFEELCSHALLCGRHQRNQGCIQQQGSVHHRHPGSPPSPSSNSMSTLRWNGLEPCPTLKATPGSDGGRRLGANGGRHPRGAAEVGDPGARAGGVPGARRRSPTRGRRRRSALGVDEGEEPEGCGGRRPSERRRAVSLSVGGRGAGEPARRRRPGRRVALTPMRWGICRLICGGSFFLGGFRIMLIGLRY